MRRRAASAGRAGRVPGPPFPRARQYSSLFLHSIISQSRARDNTAATTLPCFQAIKWLSNIAKCLYSVWVLHLDTEARTCIVFFLVTEAYLRCRVVAVAKQTNCRVPSSVLVII